MSDGDTNFGYVAFHYIHDNPLKANLVSKLEDWIYSSFGDYAGLRNGNLCDKELASQLIGFNEENFVTESYKIVDDKVYKKIFINDDWI